MRNFPFFRRRLAHRLRACAVNRRRACAGYPTGHDLAIIARLDRLARESEQVPQVMIDEVAGLCADPTFARRFDQVWETLPDVLGSPPMPTSAGHLVRWMVDKARRDPGCDAAGRGPGGTRDGPETPGNSRRLERTLGIASSIAVDFTGAFAVVGPMLAVWEGATAVGQWRDRAFAASHPATSATVVSVETGLAGRSIVPPATETLLFTPTGGQSCRVPIQVGNRAPDELGRVLTVVPRSSDCEAPLVPASIGDPLGSILVALAFLAAGVGSVKAFTRLRGRRVPPRAATGTLPLSMPVTP